MEPQPLVEQESPWALQLVARIEKTDPPATPAVCAAAVLATIELLDDDRSQVGGPWHDAVNTWNGERIRKLVRRGRGAAWERAQSADGLTVQRDGAEVRAFVPSPMDQAPREVTKLQIQSTPLTEVAAVSELPQAVNGALLIAVTPLFDMSWGKQAAQCAHAGQRAWILTGPETVATWQAAGRPIVIVHPDRPLWLSLDAVADVHIHDGGFTEIPPGTNTTLAWWQNDPA